MNRQKLTKKKVEIFLIGMGGHMSYRYSDKYVKYI